MMMIIIAAHPKKENNHFQKKSFEIYSERKVIKTHLIDFMLSNINLYHFLRYLKLNITKRLRSLKKKIFEKKNEILQDIASFTRSELRYASTGFLNVENFNKIIKSS